MLLYGKGLFGIQLNDQRFVHIEVNVFTNRSCNDFSFKSIAVNFEPLRDRMRGIFFDHSLDLIEGAALFHDGNNLARLGEIRGDVNSLAVHGEMAVYNELARFGAAARPTASVNDVVESRFEDRKELFTGFAGLFRSHFVVFCKLAFQNAVVALGLLLRAKLRTVFGSLFASLAVLTGGVCSALDRAFTRIASCALEEELFAFSAA